MIISINISDEQEEKELIKCASENGIPVPVYAGNIISSWLKNRITETYIEFVKEKNNSELKEVFGDHITIQNNKKEQK